MNQWRIVFVQSVNESFEELRHRLKQGIGIRNVSDDPVFYLVFPPEKMLEVKKRFKTWKAKLNKDGWKVDVLSMIKVTHEIFKNHDLYNDWLIGEQDAPLEFRDINDTLREALTSRNKLNDKIKEHLETLKNKEKCILFITDIEALHPYIRVGILEQKLAGCFTVPTVIFYPGIRDGNALRFLGVYQADGNYRSVHIGG